MSSNKQQVAPTQSVPAAPARAGSRWALAALRYLTGAVGGEQAAALSGLFNTTTRTGGVIGTAAFGTVYLALAPHPDRAVHGFGVTCLALAATALAAAVMAGLAVRAARPA